MRRGLIWVYAVHSSRTIQLFWVNMGTSMKLKALHFILIVTEVIQVKGHILLFLKRCERYSNSADN